MQLSLTCTLFFESKIGIRGRKIKLRFSHFSNSYKVMLDIKNVHKVNKNSPLHNLFIIVFLACRENFFGLLRKFTALQKIVETPQQALTSSQSVMQKPVADAANKDNRPAAKKKALKVARKPTKLKDKHLKSLIKSLPKKKQKIILMKRLYCSKLAKLKYTKKTDIG